MKSPRRLLIKMRGGRHPWWMTWFDSVESRRTQLAKGQMYIAWVRGKSNAARFDKIEADMAYCRVIRPQECGLVIQEM